MALTPGTRLGPYEIVAPLGSGGMGEVYRARDPRLDRVIAIKVLPSDAASDPERRERFEREARAVAALNHPNIVTIHSVEAADGRVFLTMELVEGKTLDEAIPKGGFALDRLLRIAIPIADAVAAAHQKGITHRDLKPANIMLGEGDQADRVKVLDFGLAKLVAAAPAGVSLLPTAVGTGEGRILGTVAYMSPEQAEGKPIDARSDLFSLGVVLYEMATGQRPYSGDTSVAILSSIIKDTPRRVTDVNPRMPRDFGRIVHRALTKDPERRYQTAKDLRNDLEEVKTSLESGELMTAGPAEPRPHHASPSSDAQIVMGAVRRHPKVVIAVGLALVVAIAGMVYVASRRSPVAVEPRALTLADLEVTQLTTTGNAERPAISPDGKYVAYIQRDGDDTSLWIRQTTTPSNVQIVAHEPGTRLFDATVTPDGSFVDFARLNVATLIADVWRVPFLGGTPKRIVENVGSATEWAPDGRHFAFVRQDLSSAFAGSNLLIVSDADGGHERVLAKRPRTAVYLGYQTSAVAPPNARPVWSPDGRTIGVTGFDATGPTGQIILVDTATGTERVLPVDFPAWGGLGWLDDATLLTSTSTSGAGGPGQLWRRPIGRSSASRLTNDLNSYAGVSLTAAGDMMVTSRIERRIGIWAGDGQAMQGTERVLPTPFEASGNGYGMTWAGDRLLYTDSANNIMRLLPGSGKPAEAITKGFNPLSSPDDKTLVVLDVDAGNVGTTGWYKMDADGGHRVKLVSGFSFAGQFTPDGRQIIFIPLPSGVPMMVSVDGGTPTPLVNQRAVDVRVSPDGRSMILVGFDEKNGAHVYVCDFPTCASRREVPSVFHPVWLPNGREIAYIGGGPLVAQNLYARPVNGGAERQLTHFTDGRVIAEFSWSRDGQRLAIARATVTSDIVLIKGLKR
jgi:Tol biopolymer transport system component